MINTASARPAPTVPLWVPGDWDAFFGLFTNALLNVLVLTGLVLGVVKLPNDVVFGRILPALGIALPLGNLWYAYLPTRWPDENAARTSRRCHMAPACRTCSSWSSA